MNNLTPDLVLSKTKAKNLDSIRKLNFWASNLEDISLLENIPNVEILTLSVNNITSLKHVQYCKNLAELYIRNNKIKDLKEIFYLKELKNLKILWLEENDCANVYNYRMTVLKNLPYLQKLDNSVVTKEEIEQALIDGDLIEEPPLSKTNSEISSESDVLCETFNSTMFKQEANNYILPKMDKSNNEENQNENITSIETDLSPQTSSNLESDNIETEPIETTLDNSNQIFQKSNVLTAILILINNLNKEELETLIETCQNRIKNLD